MNVQQLLNCQVATWLPKFQHVAYKTRLIDLPTDFVEFLVADGVYLPEGSAALPTRVPPSPSDDDDYKDWSDEEEPSQSAADSTVTAEKFRGVLDEIQEAIIELGGAVTPKLNWSCPQDAVWVATGGSHRCTNAEEVLLLLKASDRIAHDICHAVEGCNGIPEEPQRFTLALRKWHALRPGREFRCFVRGHDLVGISQRQVSEHFPGLAAQKGELLEALLAFFEENVENRFPDPDFTFDVYVTSAGKVKLVDFNPVGGTTSSLLFSWEELGYEAASAPQPERNEGPSQNGAASPAADLHSQSRENGGNGAHLGANGREREDGRACESQGVEFRVVDEPNRVQPNMPTYGVPFDMVDTSEGSAVDELLQRLRDAQVQQADDR